MREEQFRERFQQALGSPPTNLSSRVEATLAGASSRPRSLALGPVAVTVALLLVGAFAGWRLLDQRHVLPAGTKQSAAPTPTAVPITDTGLPVCRMPVIMSLESGPPAQMQSGPGFINTGTGRYTPDPSASVAGLPGGNFVGSNIKPSAPAGPTFYSESLHRWLPVDGRSVSPDGASYVWERLLPDGSNYSNFRQSELHRYDVATSTDRTLWIYAGSIDVVRWDASGILLDTVPPTGGVQISWVVNPATGNATQQASGFDTHPRLTQLPGDPLQNGGFGYGSVSGAEFRGHQIFRIGSREPGSAELLVFETAPGQRVTIYRGSQGDATGFDPLSGVGDADGVWFSDFSGALWRWQPATGLRKLILTNLPSPLAGPNSGRYAIIVGPCVPLK